MDWKKILPPSDNVIREAIMRAVASTLWQHGKEIGQALGMKDAFVTDLNLPEGAIASRKLIIFEKKEPGAGHPECIYLAEISIGSLLWCPAKEVAEEVRAQERARAGKPPAPKDPPAPPAPQQAQQRVAAPPRQPSKIQQPRERPLPGIEHVGWTNLEPGDVLVNFAGLVREIVAIDHKAKTCIVKWRWTRYGAPMINGLGNKGGEGPITLWGLAQWLTMDGNLVDQWEPKTEEARETFEAYKAHQKDHQKANVEPAAEYPPPGLDMARVAP